MTQGYLGIQGTIWGFRQMEVPQNGWFMRDILIRMDDLRDLGAPAILRIFMVICPACEFLPGLLIHAQRGPLTVWRQRQMVAGVSAL